MSQIAKKKLPIATVQDGFKYKLKPPKNSPVMGWGGLS